MRPARRCSGCRIDFGTVLLIAVVALAALALVGCEPLFPDVEDWIVDSEMLAQRFDARLGDLQECLEEDDCGEVLDSGRERLRHVPVGGVARRACTRAV